MFYTYQYLYNQSATRLNKHLLYFFRKLRSVSTHDNFRIDETLFHPEFVRRLNRANATELRSKFEHFFNNFKHLLPLEKTSVLQQFDNIQSINLWLSDISLDASTIKNINLPTTLREPCKLLFTYLYEKTIKKALSDHYEAIYDTLTNKYCPFCAIEQLPNKNDRKADYDHWLNKNDYPFLAVNMRNLVPIGEHCNQIYKYEQDILIDDLGHRRKFYNPYTQHYSLRLDLSGSILPTSTDRTPEWQISFYPSNDFVTAWDKVFKIKSRYSHELTNQFNHWLDVFVKANRGRGDGSLATLKQLFMSHAGTFDDYLYHESNLIKHGLFCFLASCNDDTFYQAVLERLK